MKSFKIFLSVMVSSAFILYACSKSDEQTETQNTTGTGGGGTPATTTCDTVNMMFAANIQPIFQTNCYACHGNGLSQNGVSLDSYAKVKAVVDNGKLIGVITHAPGYPPMPDGGPKLSDCNINKIRDWINRGAQNN
jgi:hypothetical protein